MLEGEYSDDSRKYSNDNDTIESPVSPVRAQQIYKCSRPTDSKSKLIQRPLSSSKDHDS